MPKIIEGSFVPPDRPLAIVAARFNEVVVEKLIHGALDTLRRHGVPDSQVEIIRVPGSFELPLVARQTAETHRYAAVICLGAVIQGDTDHYDYVCSATTSGIASASLQTGVPILFGVLTCDTMEQAIDRAGGKGGNKASDCALAALEMADLLKKLA
jgi:6,7-dimethyl-8-ribityllumazine synthase